MPVNLTEISLATLAREMVMNIRSYKEVFAEYGIDETDYYEIEKNPFYHRIKEQLTLEWNATLELGSINESVDIVTRVAGLDNSRDTTNKSGERFVIQINLGGETETYDKAVAPKVIEHEGGTDGQIDSRRPQQIIDQPIRPPG